MLSREDDETVASYGINGGEQRESEGGFEEKQYELWSRQRLVASLRSSKVIR